MARRIRQGEVEGCTRVDTNEGQRMVVSPSSSVQFKESILHATDRGKPQQRHLLRGAIKSKMHQRDAIRRLIGLVTGGITVTARRIA